MHQIIWASVCICFSNLNSLAFPIDSEISEIQPELSGLSVFCCCCFFLFLLLMLLSILDTNSFLKPEIPLALKVLQVFPGKMIAWKGKSSMVNVPLRTQIWISVRLKTENISLLTKLPFLKKSTSLQSLSPGWIALFLKPKLNSLVTSYADSTA